jgi:hypothetical protein
LISAVSLKPNNWDNHKALACGGWGFAFGTPIDKLYFQIYLIYPARNHPQIVSQIPMTLVLYALG